MNTVIAGAMAFVLILAILIAGTTKKAIADEGKTVFQKLARASVMVEATRLDDKDRVVYGTGVVIGRHPSGALRVLTCAHVLEAPADIHKLRVRIAGDGDEGSWVEAPAVVEKIDGPRDLALITVMKAIDRDVLPIALVQPENFSDVYIFGNPADAPATASKGVLSRKRRRVTLRPGSTFYQITGFAYHGSSGGPVADEWGRLIGIVSNIGTDGTVYLLNVAIAIDLKSIRDFLKP
jgi:S1-C subfamily serine protease